MALDYPDVLDHYDRSKAFGDPRDFKTFANDMESLHPGEGFGDAAQRDGWWTRLSTRLDQNLFQPVAHETTEPLGREIGGLFGQEEAGARVGRGLPRALAETAPLYLAGPEAGIPATIAAAGATGGLMGAHTYAETGSPKAAVISGVTGAALPGVGRLGGGILPRVLKLGESVPAATLEETVPESLGTSVTKTFPGGVLPAAGVGQGAFKAARFTGSQAAMIGLNQASLYATDKTLGQPYDPTSPDFWLQQIPFTVFDAAHGFEGRVPTAAEVRAQTVSPKKTVSQYVPPEVSQPEADATIEATMANLRVAYLDPNTPPEQKGAALAAANALIQNPKGVTAAAKVVKQPEVPQDVTGYAKQYSNGNWKVLQIDEQGNEKTVWVNGVEPARNYDGTMTFRASSANVSPNVATPLTRMDFGIDPNQPELPPQANPLGIFPWELPEYKAALQQDQQRTLEANGIKPPAEMPDDVRQLLRQETDKIEQSQQTATEARAKATMVPKTAEDIPALISKETSTWWREEMVRRGLNPARTFNDVDLQNPSIREAIQADPTLTDTQKESILTTGSAVKDIIKLALDSGGTPKQAIEKARLATQTPVVDAAEQQTNTSRETAKVISLTGEGQKPQAQYADYVRDDNGENFKTRGYAEAYRDVHPEYADHVVRDAGKGKGFYLGRQINKEVSLEGTNLEKVLGSTTDPAPLESRPDVSFEAGLTQLDRASQNPVVFARGTDFDSVADAILALRQAKVVFPLLKAGKTFDDIQAALAEAKVSGFTSPRNAVAVMDAVREGLGNFTNTTRSFTMDSIRPFDQKTVDEIGIQHPDAPTAVRNVLQWFVNHKDSGVLGDIVNAALKAHGTDGLNLTLNPREGTFYREDERRINMANLPAEGEGFDFATHFVHEYMHDVTVNSFYDKTPTSVAFRATLTEGLNALKNSPNIPKNVRTALSKVPKWYEEYSNSGDPFKFYKNWTDVAGTEQDEWLHVVYALASEKELVSSMFTSPKLVELMLGTKMPTKPVTVMQYISTAWNKLFGGKKEADNVLSHVLSGLDNYLSGDRMPPRDVKVGPTLPAGQGFFYGLAQYDPAKNMLGGKHKLPNSGVISEQQLKSTGGIGKPLSDGEVELYKSIVPEAWQGTQVNVPKLVEGLKTKGPVVETKNLTDEPQPKEQIAWDNLQRANSGLQHMVETQFPGYRIVGGTIVGPDGAYNRLSDAQEARYQTLPERLRQAHEAYTNNMQRLDEMENTPEGWGMVGGHSSYAAIGPKPEKQMPGYVEGLVRLPLPKEDQAALEAGAAVGGDPFTSADPENTVFPKYTGPHFGSEDRNVLSFYRGYEETLPDGTKAFHVIEVQSDWAQKLQKGRKDERSYEGHYGIGEPGHPLLKVYESLALKAAIQHAKKVGASKVILSDAETAMMTEGHDRYFEGGEVFRNALIPQGREELVNKAKEAGLEIHPRGDGTYHVFEENRGDSQKVRDFANANNLATITTGSMGQPVTGEPEQAKGMRLHYDQTLPSTMEKLTGDKGKGVNLGPHKSGMSDFEQESYSTFDEAQTRATEAKQASPESKVDVVRQPDGQWGVVMYDSKGSPVFRDANGQPKTQITGRSYDISKVPEQQTLFEPKTPSTTVRQSYNGRDYLRDYLVSNGVRPEALASRISTVESVFSGGSLQPSIDGFTREMGAGILPTTTEAGPLKPKLTTALTSGEPATVRDLTKLLIANDVPVHEDLYARMKEDVEAAVSLYTNIRKGLIPGELPPNAKESLQKAQVRLDAMSQGLRRQRIDIQRFNDLHSLTPEGMQQTWIAGLSSDRTPLPPDPTEMQRQAHEALGLVDQRREVSRATLEQGKVGVAANWIRKNFMFMQYMKELIPATKPIIDNLFKLQGTTNFWKNELDAVYEMDPVTKEFDKTRKDANLRVATNPTLQRAASDIKLWNQTEEAAEREPSLSDPYVQNILTRFNKPDRDALISESNNAKAVHDHWTEVTTPRYLAQKNQATVAKVVALREQGMQPDAARDIAGQFASALDQMKSPQTAQQGLEILNVLRPKMQPETFLSAFGLMKGLQEDSAKHIDFMRSRPNYVTEQRLDGKHAIRMVTPDNKPYLQSFGTRELALAKVKELEGRGYKYLEYIPAQDLNVPYRGVSEEFIGKLRELDLQTQTRVAQAMQGVDPTIVNAVLPEFGRASDYEQSLAAFSPVPGAGFPKRHFAAGREELNMVQQQNMFYGRAVNWMRHQLTRGETELDMLHPDMLADREATKMMRDKVTEFLTPDSPLARKMSEFTYNWKLAGNFGVNALHLVQSLNTGMASLISETGGVGDALELTVKAQKAIADRVFNGKWASKDHDWLTRRAGAEGVLGNVTWEGDIGDSKRNALQYATTPLWNKPIEGLKYAARSWNGAFFKFNDAVGLISSFDLGRSRGMGYEEAYNFARDVKNRGYFTGGKVQRSGFWSAFGPQAKAVPQLMSSLQTYVQGWFSLLTYNYTRGFGKAPQGMSAAQVLGAKKAFLYQLGAQAVLAGALGLPGVGQGMALVKQSTGVDVMSWLRQNLGEMFDEDQKAGGLMTTLALHGLPAAASEVGIPSVDLSGRHMPSVPYIGVTPYKGFDVANLAGAPISAAADLVKGLMAAAKGDVSGASSLLPEVLKGPLRLWQGEGDVRDKGGNLITKLSPYERAIVAMGLKPPRVTALQDVATAVKEANARASAEKSSIVDAIATTYRKNGVEQGHQALIQYLQQHPNEDGKALVREVSRRVVNQTTVPDWSQRANVAADLSGLGGEATSQAQRYSQTQDIQASLGLHQRPSRTQPALMDQIDLLRETDPYLSVAEAEQLARSPRRRRPNIGLVPPEYQ